MKMIDNEEQIELSQNPKCRGGMCLPDIQNYWGFWRTRFDPTACFIDFGTGLIKNTPINKYKEIFGVEKAVFDRMLKNIEYGKSISKQNKRWPQA